MIGFHVVYLGGKHIEGPRLAKLRRCLLDVFILETAGLKRLRVLLLFLAAFAKGH